MLSLGSTEQEPVARGLAKVPVALGVAGNLAWKDAGVPLEAVLRGIDEAFDRYDKRPSKTRKVNSLAYCAQAVLAAAEEMKEAAVGASAATGKKQDEKFTADQITAFLQHNAETLRQRAPALPALAQPAAAQAADSLGQMADSLASLGSNAKLRLEELEQRLTVLEEKIFASLTAAQSEEDLLNVRTEVDREMAPYRGKMSGRTDSALKSGSTARRQESPSASAIRTEATPSKSVLRSISPRSAAPRSMVASRPFTSASML